MSVTNAPTVELQTDLATLADPETSDLFATWKAIPGELSRLALERARAELATAEALTARTKRADEALAQGTAEADQRRQRETAEINALTTSLRSRANKTFQSEAATAQDEHQTKRKTATLRHRKEHHDAKTAHEAGRWEHGTLYETSEKGATEARTEAKKHLARMTQALKDLHEQTADVQSFYRGYLAKNPAIPGPEVAPVGIDPFEPLALAVEEADADLRKLEAATLPRPVPRCPHRLGVPLAAVDPGASGGLFPQPDPRWRGGNRGGIGDRVRVVSAHQDARHSPGGRAREAVAGDARPRRCLAGVCASRSISMPIEPASSRPKPAARQRGPGSTRSATPRPRPPTPLGKPRFARPTPPPPPS